MKINHFIDHTMLKADAGKDMIEKYCKEAVENGFASVCVNTYYVPLAAKLLKGSKVKTCAVVGFPLGAMISAAKAFEAEQACICGAEEIDMVINIGALKDGDEDLVREDIKGVIKASKGACVKVIIETCLLTREEKIRVCRLAVEAGADYVKTSTGFASGGAKEEDIRLMKESVAGRAKIKASGGIRTAGEAERMIEAGADRIGTGNGMLLI
ncbi:MAG: deoxyribose-phosphate aldolase [Johnsonella sp.]|nr:deoxyribose-phosphate aldolase [Johnsonella sp.]